MENKDNKDIVEKLMAEVDSLTAFQILETATKSKLTTKEIERIFRAKLRKYFGKSK